MLDFNAFRNYIQFIDIAYGSNIPDVRKSLPEMLVQCNLNQATWFSYIMKCTDSKKLNCPFKDIMIDSLPYYV